MANYARIAAHLQELSLECAIQRRNPEAIANAAQAWADYVDLNRDDIARALIELSIRQGTEALPEVIHRCVKAFNRDAPGGFRYEVYQGRLILFNGDEAVGDIASDNGTAEALIVFAITVLGLVNAGLR